MTSITDEVVKSLRVLAEMLHDRGIDGTDAIGTFTDSEVASIMKTKQSFNIDIDNKVRVIYVLNPRPKWADVKKYFPSTDDGETEFESMILVTREKLNSGDMKKLIDLPKLQAFEIKELQINISKHVLVPKHELITDEEVISELVAKYQLKSRNQFPIILKTDPMAKYLNAKSGNLVKVTRYSPTSAEYIVYRCCM